MSIFDPDSYFLCHVFPILFPVDGCETENGQKCIFPFNYDGTTYSECTSVDHDRPWCAIQTPLTVDIDGNLVDEEWGNCDSTCSSCPPGWQGQNCDNESKLGNPRIIFRFRVPWII